MTDASNEGVAVIQADRDFAAKWIILAPENASIIRAGNWDHHDGVQAALRHRIAHSDPRPVAEGLREALRASLAKRSQPTMDPPYTAAFNAALDMVAKDVAPYLATHSPAPMAGEAIRAVTSEMRRFMPNSCGDWADKIDAALAGPAQPLTIAESAEYAGYIHGKDYRDNSVEAVAHRQARFVELNKRYLAAHPSTQEGGNADPS